MKLNEILCNAVDNQASDIFIVSGVGLSYKANGRLVKMDGGMLSPDDTKRLVHEIFTLGGYSFDIERMPEEERDFSVSIVGMGRFRANI